MECGEPFYKKVECLNDVIFILQHFDWVLCINLIVIECDWMNYLDELLDEFWMIGCESPDIIIVKKKFEDVLGNSKNSGYMFP